MKVKELNADYNSAEYLGSEAGPEDVPPFKEWLLEHGVSPETEVRDIPDSLWLEGLKATEGQKE